MVIGKLEFTETGLILSGTDIPIGSAEGGINSFVWLRDLFRPTGIRGGTHFFHNEPYPPVTGACCFGSSCQDLGANQCDFAGGVFQGTDTDCTPNPC